MALSFLMGWSRWGFSFLSRVEQCEIKLGVDSKETGLLIAILVYYE
jgi:hypothetical protein